MAKYDITHTCGHTETVELYGRMDERQRRIAWLESKPCRECERKAANEGMAELEGTEKQVAWAMDIRVRLISRFEDGMNERLNALRGRISEEQLAQARERMAKDVDAMKAETSAKWWIEHRDATDKQLIEHFRMA